MLGAPYLARGIGKRATGEYREVLLQIDWVPKELSKERSEEALGRERVLAAVFDVLGRY